MSNFLTGLATGGASALADLGGSLLGTAVSSLIGPSWRTQARFQRDMQKDLMSHQAELNKQQYDYEFQKEAEYNSPSAERARLEAAGMNPALAYGGGASGGSGVQASVGSVSGGSVGQAKPLSLAENSLDLTSLAQIQNMAAQSENLKAASRKTNAEAENLERLNEGGEPEARIAVLKAEEELKTSQAYNEQAQARLADLTRQTNELTQFYDVQLARSNWKLVDKRVSEVMANVRWLDAQTGRMSLLTPLDVRNTELLGIKTGAEIGLIAVRTELEGMQGWESYYRGQHYRESALGLSYENDVKPDMLQKRLEEIGKNIDLMAEQIRERAALAGQAEWQKEHMWLGSAVQGATALIGLVSNIGGTFVLNAGKKALAKLTHDLSAPKDFVETLERQFNSMPWNTTVTDTLPDWQAPIW